MSGDDNAGDDTAPPPPAPTVSLSSPAQSVATTGGAEGAYTHMDVGNCDGHTFITSRVDCDAAAVALGLDDTVSTESSSSAASSDWPYGCYYKWANTPGTKLWFNPDGTRSSSDTVRTSICHESKHPFLEVSSWKGLQAMTLHPSKLHIPNIVHAADSGARWLAAA